MTAWSPLAVDKTGFYNQQIIYNTYHAAALNNAKNADIHNNHCQHFPLLSAYAWN